MKDIKKSVLVLLLLLLTVSGYAVRSSSLFFEDLITDKDFQKSITETGQTLITVTLKKVLETDKAGKESKGNLEIYISVVDQAEKNGSLDEIKEVLEKKVKEGKATPQILFTLSMVYERKGMKREAYKTLEKVEKAVKQQPKIAFNLSLVYGRKKTLKSQIDKAEAEAFALTHGSVDVKSVPEGVEVYLNGDKKGETPIVLKGLDEGAYTVELRKEDYIKVDRTVTVKAQQTVELSEEMELLPGGIKIKSDPAGSTILLNGDNKGVTPLTISEMKAGEYKITLKKDGYEDKNISVTVNPGKTAAIDTRLTALTGSLSLFNLTEGAEVMLDGERVYPRNNRIQDISVGSHHVVIKKVRYDNNDIYVTIDPGQTRYISGQLKKAVFVIPYADIKIDGKLNDWAGVQPLFIDPEHDNVGGQKGTDIRSIYIARDNRYVYVRFDLASYESRFNYDFHVSFSPVSNKEITLMLLSEKGATQADLLQYFGPNKKNQTKTLGPGSIRRKGNIYESRYSLKTIERYIPEGENIKVFGYSTGIVGSDKAKRTNFDETGEAICFLY